MDYSALEYYNIRIGVLMYKRIILLVMDSVGIGHAADALKFGDEGSNTLGHIESAARPDSLS